MLPHEASPFTNYLHMKDHSQPYEKASVGYTRIYEEGSSISPEAAIATANIEVINAEMRWCMQLFEQRLQAEEEKSANVLLDAFPAPDLTKSQGAYAELVRKHQLVTAERLLLILALLPHFRPEVLTRLCQHETQYLQVKYAEAGGYIDRAFNHFIPTVSTVLFVLAGRDNAGLIRYHHDVVLHGKLVREQIIRLHPLELSTVSGHWGNQVPSLSSEYVLYLLEGQRPRPDFGSHFPAHLIQTSLQWEDLVLPSHTADQVQEIKHWMDHGKALQALDHRKIKGGYPCLFFGPPGTGKTLTAKLLGNYADKEVFRIDLSMVVSKYIGETEKNLAYLFDRAQGKDWILFFDEADALFGKRTNIGDAQDKWANLEMSYLLQRMEEYDGITILATNLKSNLDNALIRRFQSMIEFPYPKDEERLLLWEKSLPDGFSYHEDLNMKKVARYQFTGGNVSNILKTACLAALAAETRILDQKILSRAIVKELAKESRTP